MGLIGKVSAPGIDRASELPLSTSFDTSPLHQDTSGYAKGRGGIFGRLGKLDWGTALLGGVADGIAMWGGGKPGYATALAENRDWQREIAKAKLLAMLKDDGDTATIKSLKAAGIEPNSDEGRRIVTDSLTRPFMVGSAETGWSPVGGSYGMPASGNAPTFSTKEQYDAAPSGTEFIGPDGVLRRKP